MSDYLSESRKKVGNTRLIVPGVRAIILNDNFHILLQLRKDMACWGLPGGAIEPNETVLNAVIREVEEETALQIIDAEPMALYSGPSQRFSYPNGDQVQGFAAVFIVWKWKGEARPDGVEGMKLQFFRVNNLPNNLLGIHKNTINDFFYKYNGQFFIS